jgi:DNA-binding transcriptional LysR family regulator
VSLPLVSSLVLPVLGEFMREYPEIELDLDFTDQLVDVIEEGFDAVVRTGEPSDSRLTARRLGLSVRCWWLRQTIWHGEGHLRRLPI